MLLVDLETGVQEKWIMEHVSLLNANLCIAIGGVVNLLTAQEKKIPHWIEKLHLAGLYHKIVREQTVKKRCSCKYISKESSTV